MGTSNIDHQRFTNWSFIFKTNHQIFAIISKRYTVLVKRVWYFVLLNYSCKSWSNFKTRDRFGICRSWGFQNTPYMSNLTKFWLRYLRLKTHDTILLFSCYLICWRWKWQKSEQFVPKTVLFTIKGTNINKNNP